jgi:hypothetical protein
MTNPRRNSTDEFSLPENTNWVLAGALKQAIGELEETLSEVSDKERVQSRIAEATVLLACFQSGNPRQYIRDWLLHSFDYIRELRAQQVPADGNCSGEAPPVSSRHVPSCVQQFLQRHPGPFFYERGRNGVDQTFDVICSASGAHVHSSGFWDDADNAESNAATVMLALNQLRDAN